MRLLLVEASGRGFLSHYSHALALGMYRIGVQVQLLTGQRDELSDWSVPFPKQACLAGGAGGWRCLRRHVMRLKPDVVHLQWVDNPLQALRFVVWAQRQRVRVIYTPHNILPHERRWLLMPLYQLLYRRLDRVVARDAHLAWALEEVLEMPAEKVVQLPGSPNYLALQMHEKAEPSLFPRLPGEQRLLFFGHGCPRKGLGRLLSVVAENAWPAHLHLLVAGEGVLCGVSAELLTAAAGKMRLSVIDRYIAPADVAALFSGADMLLMPYIKQCKSPLLDLAAALQLPVLRSNRVQGAAFRDGVHGATYAHDDEAALCRLLMHRHWVEQSAAILADQHDPVTAMDRLAEGHERLYHEVLAQSARRVEDETTALPLPQPR